MIQVSTRLIVSKVLKNVGGFLRKKSILRKRFLAKKLRVSRDVGMYPYDTSVMRSEFKSPNERLDERFRVVEPRMCADSLMRKVVDKWISRFNIRRMFSRFRLTKSDDHQMPSSNGRLFLLSISVLPFKSIARLKAHAVASSATPPTLYNCNFNFRERDYD